MSQHLTAMTSSTCSGTGSPQMASTISLLLVDDEKLVAQSIAEYFDDDSDVSVVGIATDVEGARAAISQQNPDIVLCDVVMPGGGGMSLLKYIGSLSDPPVFISMTGLDCDSSMLETLTNGGAGYILKSSPPDTFRRAVRDGISGGTTVSPQCLSRLVGFIPMAHSENPRFTRLISGLLPREIAVLRMVTEGRPNSEIATMIRASESTTKRIVSKLMEIFGANSRVELALRFRSSDFGT